MTIMRQETPEGRDPERWRSARAWLRRLPGWGIRTVQEVQKERTVILQDMLRRMMKQEELKELEWAVENEGVQLRIVWTGDEQRNAQTPQTPKLREAARGEELIGGTVRQRGKKGYVAGKITGFDGSDYDVRLYNGLQMKWSEEDVRDRWVADQYTIRRGWTALDQKTLQTGVKGVVARKVEETKHRHVVPFPSKIDGNVWAVMETWYTCTMKAPDTGQVRTLLREGRDKQAAELLVTQGTLFWAPALTWQGWAASVSTSKAGWWVRATGVRMEKQEVILEIRSVQRAEFHRQGDIRVDGPDPKKGATVGVETGNAGDGPSHGRTGRGRAGEERWGVPSMRGIAGIQGEGAESGSRKERGAAGSPNTAATREEGCGTACH